MAWLSVRNVVKHFGTQTVLNGLDMQLDAGQRVGLIGRNGSGKTTLMRLIAGQTAPDEGEVTIPAGITVGYLSQEPQLNPANTIRQEAESAFAELRRIEAELHRVSDLLQHEHDGPNAERLLFQLGHLQEKLHHQEGWNTDHRVERVLMGVGFDEAVFDRPVQVCSGGQRSRVALAKLLLLDPDILLLDEPTNHLDLAGCAWLEDTLLAFPGALLVVSHDRHLLNRICTDTLLLDRGRAEHFPGNYARFVVLREERRLAQQRAYVKQQEYIAKEREFIERFRAGQRAKEAQGRETRLERLLTSDELIAPVSTQRDAIVRFLPGKRSGDIVLSTENLGIRYGEKSLFDGVSLEVLRGQKIGIVGSNGTGKTSLIETLIGKRQPTAGQVKLGSALDIGYFDQLHSDLAPDRPALYEVQSASPQWTEQQVRDLLGALGISGDSVFKPCGSMSGGEQSRVMLAKLMVYRKNVLVMDEPTNHLDVDTTAALEEALKGFDGTLIVVSHDRTFLEQVVDGLFLIENQNVTVMKTDFERFWQRVKRQAELTPDPSASAPGKRTDPAAGKRRDASSGKRSEPARPEPGRSGATTTSSTPPATTTASSDRAEPAAAPAPKGKNKYANLVGRPFHKLSVTELERRLAANDAALKAANEDFTSPAVLRDKRKAAEVMARIEALKTEADQLAEEWVLKSEADGTT